ncbi:unnamed protein product [Ectocarpus sp. 6 AP-2014]
MTNSHVRVSTRRRWRGWQGRRRRNVCRGGEGHPPAGGGAAQESGAGGRGRRGLPGQPAASGRLGRNFYGDLHPRGAERGGPQAAGRRSALPRAPPEAPGGRATSRSSGSRRRRRRRRGAPCGS